MSPADVVAPGEPVRSARGGATRGFLASELRALLGRRRTWALLLVLAAIPVLIAVAVDLASTPPRPGEGPPFLDRVTSNGLFVAVTGLTVTIPLFLPLAVGVVAGDAIAGEASLGTLRYLLTVPVGRTRLLVVKYLSSAVFCAVATLVVAVVGGLVGVALFGTGPVTLLSGDTVGTGAALLRVLLVAAYVTVSLLGLAAVGLFVSTLTEVPVGAMATTAVLAIVSQVLDGIPQLGWLHPWLFSHRWLDYADLLREPIAWGSFAHNALLQAGYVVVFGLLAWARFTSADVTS